MNDALWKVCPWDSTSFSMLYQVGVATKIYEEINHYQYIATEKKKKKKETGELSITTIEFMWFYH